MKRHPWQGARSARDRRSAPGIVRRASRIVLLVALGLGGTAPAIAQTGATAQAGAENFVGPKSFAKLAQAALPAVVNVSATQNSDVAKQGSGDGGPAPNIPPGSPFEEFFRHFFDQLPQGQAPEPPMGELTAVGSGFIIDPDGYIVTNGHVVADAEKVTITLHDDTELPAKVVGIDPRTDLALLKVDAKRRLPYVEWGDSDAAQVGDWVMAVGNPFGLGGTVTTGIISARARDINAGPYDDFLQTDASINRGNSGGPLFDMAGKVIGVNTAIFSPSGGNIGIGFAVPSSMAKPIIAELRQTGTVRRGWLGVSIQPVTPEIAEAVGLDKPHGALVADVLEGTPASQAGLQTGDVLLTFNGRNVKDADSLSRMVAKTKVDQRVEIGILRDGQQKTIEAKITLLREEPQQVARATPERQESPRTSALGLSMAELSPDLRRKYDIPEDAKGVLVLDVAEGSAAADQNIAPGDIITKVGRTAVSKPSEVVAAIEQARRENRNSVLVLRERDGNPGFVALPTQPKQG